MPVHDQIVSDLTESFKKELVMSNIDALFTEVDDFNQKSGTPKLYTILVSLISD